MKHTVTFEIEATDMRMMDATIGMLCVVLEQAVGVTNFQFTEQTTEGS